MAEIVNILLLIIIFVFDPLAIALVLAANFAFDRVVKKELQPVQEPEKELEKQVQPIAKAVNNKNVDEVEIQNKEVLEDTKQEIQTEQKVEDSTLPEEVFDINYTGVEFKDIVKILQKTPGYFAVLLKNGKRVKLPRDFYHKLEQENSNIKTY
jgi:hypothetical protein